MSTKRTITGVVLAACLLSGLGCQATPQQIGMWQQQLTHAEEEVAALRVELRELAPDSEAAVKIEAMLGKLEPYIGQLKTILADAETGGDAAWGIGETIASAAAGFFPPLAVLLPIIRSLRRTQTRVFESVKAGGGPKNTEAARKYLSRNTGAYAAYKKWEIANGD